MADYYWALFRITGRLVFYLLYRREAAQQNEARTAWCAPRTELV